MGLVQTMSGGRTSQLITSLTNRRPREGGADRQAQPNPADERAPGATDGAQGSTMLAFRGAVPLPVISVAACELGLAASAYRLRLRGDAGIEGYVLETSASPVLALRCNSGVTEW